MINYMKMNVDVICDTEAEREITWGQGVKIYCRDTQKYYLIDQETFVQLAGNVTGNAPSTAQYVTLANNSDLSAERVLTAGTGISLTDSGANGTITVASTITQISPASPDTSVQFNNGGAFGGSANLVWASNILGITGNINFINGATRKIYTSNASGSSSVNALQIIGGSAATTGAGGSLQFYSGDSGDYGMETGGNAGSISFTTGTAYADTTRGNAGNFSITTGDGSLGGGFSVTIGESLYGSGSGAAFTLGDGNDSLSNANGGSFDIYAGDGESGLGGYFRFYGGDGDGGGGGFGIATGNGTAGNANGGLISISFGSASGSGRSHEIYFDDVTGLSAEKPSIKFRSGTYALGSGQTITNQRYVQFLAPTVNGIAGGSAETITNAATVYIEGAPSGSNITLTNPYSFWVDDGVSRFDGDGTNVFEFPADATDPTGGGGAAAGRIPIKIGGATKYLAYY